MTRPNVPTVSVTLDKVRHLKLDFNAIALIEEHTEKNILKKASWENLSGSDLRIMVWAMLLDEDPDLKLTDVGAMIHFGNIEAVFEAISKIGDSLSKKGSKDDSDRPLPKTS